MEEFGPENLHSEIRESIEKMKVMYEEMSVPKKKSKGERENAA